MKKEIEKLVIGMYDDVPDDMMHGYITRMLEKDGQCCEDAREQEHALSMVCRGLFSRKGIQSEDLYYLLWKTEDLIEKEFEMAAICRKAIEKLGLSDEDKEIERKRSIED